MSTWCEGVTGTIIAVFGLCAEAPPPPAAGDFPATDPSVYAVQPEPETPPPPPPVGQPAMPPIVIERTVIQERPAAAPDPEPETEPEEEQETVEPETPEPDAIERALRQLYANGGIPARSRLGRASWRTTAETPDTPSMPAIKDEAEAPRTPETGYGYQTEGRVGSYPVDNTRILTTDRYITAILETSINSQLSGESGGRVVLQVARDVFGYHGRAVLVPKGSRLVCRYAFPGDVGSTRLALTCSRILMGGSRVEIAQLTAAGGDAQGRAGITGEVDARFFERYGSAFVIAGISAAVRLSAAAVDDGDENSELGATASEGAEELGERLGEITASVLESTVDLQPIVTVPQGTRIQISPAFDWYLRPLDETTAANGIPTGNTTE